MRRYSVLRRSEDFWRPVTGSTQRNRPNRSLPMDRGDAAGLSVLPSLDFMHLRSRKQPSPRSGIWQLQAKELGGPDMRVTPICRPGRLRMCRESVPSIHRYLSTLRQNLVSKGIVVKANGSLRFTQDYTFDSPSTAAGVLLGRSSNGRIEWRNEAGQTLKELQVNESGA